MHKRTIIFSISLLILILGEIAATIGTYYAILDRSNNNLQAQMSLVSNNAIDGLTNIVSICEYELARTTAFLRIYGINISVSTYVDMMQFDKSSIIDSIQYYMLTIKLTPNDLESYENFCKEYVIPNCTITEISNRSLIPVSNRPYYWPLIFTTLITTNISNSSNILTGFDLYSNNATKDLVDTALTPLEYTSWSRISTIVQGNVNPYNFDVILSKLALIDLDGPHNVDNTIGMASLVVSVGKVMTTAFKQSNSVVNMTNNV